MTEPQPVPDDVIFVSSIVSARTQEGLVQVQWGGKACQLPIADAINLGHDLLHAAEAALTDEAAFHIIIEKIGAPPETAAGFVEDLRRYRESHVKFHTVTFDK